jgi:hypothetical protein
MGDSPCQDLGRTFQVRRTLKVRRTFAYGFFALAPLPPAKSQAFAEPFNRLIDGDHNQDEQTSPQGQVAADGLVIHCLLLIFFVIDRKTPDRLSI